MDFQVLQSDNIAPGEHRRTARSTKKGVRSCIHPVNPLRSRLMARPPRIEFPGPSTISPYRQYGYWLHEIAVHLGVHYATVNRRLKQTEQANILL